MIRHDRVELEPVRLTKGAIQQPHVKAATFDVEGRSSAGGKDMSMEEPKMGVVLLVAL